MQPMCRFIVVGPSIVRLHILIITLQSIQNETDAGITL
jgi:hypothetical protein